MPIEQPVMVVCVTVNENVAFVTPGANVTVPRRGVNDWAEPSHSADCVADSGPSEVLKLTTTAVVEGELSVSSTGPP